MSRKLEKFTQINQNKIQILQCIRYLVYNDYKSIQNYLLILWHVNQERKYCCYMSE